MSQITAPEAAARLGVTDTRVRQLILAGRLPARKFGRAWLIEASDLEHVRVRPAGRPGHRPRPGA